MILNPIKKNIRFCFLIIIIALLAALSTAAFAHAANAVPPAGTTKGTLTGRWGIENESAVAHSLRGQNLADGITGWVAVQSESASEQITALYYSFDGSAVAEAATFTKAGNDVISTVGTENAYRFKTGAVTLPEADGDYEFTLYAVTAGNLYYRRIVAVNVSEFYTSATASREQTISYTAQNIEDFVEASDGYSFLNSGAEKDADGNIRLAASKDERMRSITVKGSFDTYAIKFKSTFNESESVWFAAEVRGYIVNSYYWSRSLNYYVGFCWEKDSLSKQRRQLFSYGQGVPGIEKIFNMPSGFEFVDGEDYTVELGAQNGNDGSLTTFIKITVGSGASEKTAFMQTIYTGLYANTAPGWLKLYNNDNSSFISGDFVVKGIEDGALNKYVQQQTITEDYAEYDISKLVPVPQGGVTYTKKEWAEGDTTQSLINASSYTVNTAVKMYATFQGSVYGAEFALYANGAWSWNGGYVISLGSNGISFAAKGKSGGTSVDIYKSQTFSWPQNLQPQSGTRFILEIGALDYYEQELIPSGKYLYAKVNNTLAAECYVEKNSGIITGSVLSGFIMGGTGSSLKIEPIEYAEPGSFVTLKTNKTKIDVDKQARLSYESKLSTLFDEVSYQIASGGKNCKLTNNELKGVKGGSVKVKAVVSNEYGEFSSTDVGITVGEGDAESVGCKGAAAGGADIVLLFLLPLLSGAYLLLRRKRT